MLCVFQETVTSCRENELIPGKSKLDDIDEPRDDTEKTLCVVKTKKSALVSLGACDIEFL